MIANSGLEPLSYDDVLLLPKLTDISSRDEVIFHNDRIGAMPVFSAPMKQISEPEMVIRISSLGGVGILHRFFNTDQERLMAVVDIAEALQDKYPFGIAIGLNDFEKELTFAQSALLLGASFICVDAANGYMKKIVRAVERLKFLKRVRKFSIISGNVVTSTGVIELAKAGSDYVRVGIGNGSLCSTSNNTGIGCPILTALYECSSAKKFVDVNLIADGGIKSSGEAVKAFAFGADAVMVGTMFGKAKEANNGGLVYGMSSFALQQHMGKKLKSNEGIEKRIPENEIRPIEEIFDEFVYGIKSGFSYLNCRTLDQVKDQVISYVMTGKGTLKNL